MYIGSIVSVLSPEKGDTDVWYKVVYTDGDEETFCGKKIEKFVKKYLDEEGS